MGAGSLTCSCSGLHIRCICLEDALNKLVIVAEGGGMRNATLSGVLHGLSQHGLQPADVSAIYACSSATGPAAYFITNQTEESFVVWIERLTSWRALNPLRPLWGQPMGDIHWVVDEAMVRLNRQALGQSSTRLMVGVMQLQTGETHHLAWNPTDGDALIKASGAMPRLTLPISIGGVPYIDGGMEKPLPFAEALRLEGSASYLVISNRPPDHIERPVSRAMARLLIPGSLPARQALLRRSAYHNGSWELIRTPPPGAKVFCLQPPPGQPCRRFERSAPVVRNAIDEGRLVVERALSKGLEQFLSECCVAAAR